MILLECLFVLISVLCCNSAPAPDTEIPAGKQCTKPEIQNGQILSGWYYGFHRFPMYDGTYFYYSCVKGFSPPNRERYGISYCTREGWDPQPTCSKQCSFPSEEEMNADIVHSQSVYFEGDKMYFFCKTGYITRDDRTSGVIECLFDGKFMKEKCLKIGESCGIPPAVNYGDIEGRRQDTYPSGSSVKYTCMQWHILDGKAQISCKNGEWEKPPSCREPCTARESDMEINNVEFLHSKTEKIYSIHGDSMTFRCKSGYEIPTGQSLRIRCFDGKLNYPKCFKTRTGDSCGKPPAVNYGDIEGRQQDTYPSGSSVKYTCMQWHILDGKAEIFCKDGEWDNPPSCREPCTIRELDMKMNNVEFVHRNFEKIYSVHGDSMTFRCISGYEMPTGKLLRVQCLDGKINYPKCFKKGFCELDQSTIKINNLYYNESDIVENGNIITFECTEGMIPEGSLDATCREKQITYPKCISSHFCSMPKLENGLLHTTKTHFEDGNIVMYTCDEGYYSEKKTFQETSYCDKSRWKPQPKCEAITCRLGTRIRVDFYNSGDVVHFKCQAGEVLNGDSTSQCYYFGWYPELPVCSVRSRNLRPLIKDDATESKCPPAPVPPNSALNYLNDNEVEIVCNQHYILSGRDRISCNNGKWQSPPMCIQVQTCSQPPSIENGQYVQTSISQYFSGSTVKYRCNEGYRMTSSDENVCTNGQWARTPTCEEKPCGKPEDIENGKVTNVKPEYQPGERVTFQCYEGYTLSRTSATCFEGTWVGIPECIDSTCGNPPTIANGKPKNPGDRDTTGKKYLPESKVEYQCNPEYSMKDVNHVICKNSQWINEPKCRKTGESCGIPPVVNYGEIDGRRQLTYTSGSSVQYTCIQWHILDGKAHISCKDGEWEMPPLCREPCTVRESDMKINNIEFVYRRTEKIYSQHGDSFTFWCVSGYEIPVGKPLRIQCLDGKVNYPKCFKKGFCELDQSTIKRNNLYYEESDIVENNHTITFECTEGMIPEGSLDATCREKQITYPKCITS